MISLTNYLRGTRWFVKTISSRGSSLVSLTYPVLIQDVDFLEDGITSGIWSWYFLIQIHLESVILGNAIYDRSQPFQGVNMQTN